MSAPTKLLLLTLLSPVLSHPLDARSPDPPVPVIVRPPDSQIFPCTATIDVPPPPCTTELPPTYAATETLYREVDCAGCLAVTLRTPIQYPCPTPAPPLETPYDSAEILNSTTTEWETVCSPTPTLPLLILPYDEVYPRQVRPACPTTLILPVESTGATATIYKDYVTVTSNVPCGGCDLVLSTMIGGMGVIRPTAPTETVEVGTTTAYQCEG